MLAGGPESHSSRQTPFVQVYTLGSFRVLVGGEPIDDSDWRRKTARQLFKVLLTRPGRRMARDEVVELFWPESDADAAASNFRSTLHAMRRALASRTPDRPGGVVFGDHDSVWLASDAELWTDASIFEQKVAEASRSADPLPLLEEASALYAGDYLPDDLYEDWAADRRDGLRRTWAELQFGLARACETRGDVNAAQQPLERLLRADPCDERAAQELMKLLARHGRRSESVRVYQRLTRSLQEELDVEPSAESAELYRQISAGESLATAAIPPSSFRCTYPFPAPSALIGREAEQRVLAQVLASGRATGRVALVSAPAGTGKSALLGEIVRQAQTQGVLCLAGGCYEEPGAVPLGPFHDALTDYLLAQPATQIRARFKTTIDDLARLLPEVRYHLGVEPSDGSGDLDRMGAFGAVHAFLRRLTEDGPVLLCLEDLHAADEATLQLLHYIARQTRRLPLVVIATYRDEEVAAGSNFAQTLATMARERLAERITLRALGRDEADALTVSLLEKPASGSLGAAVYATTGGNPLFMEQLLLALQEAGRLELVGGVWDGGSELQDSPLIVREVIWQRVQRLPVECREVLGMAAVLGQTFEHKMLLAALQPLDEQMLLVDLDQSIAAHILQDVPGGYAFRHALVRNAVYFGLSSPKRMLMHRQAGELLEQLYGPRADDNAAQLAHHFSLAGESPELRARVLHYSLVAGRRAATLSYAEALVHFDRASQIIDRDDNLATPEVRIDALSGRGRALANTAQYADGVASIRQALALSNDPIQRGRARRTIAFSLCRGGQTLALIDECQTGLQEIAGITGPDAVEIRATLQQLLGWSLARRGRFRETIDIGRAIEIEAANAQAGPRMLAHRVIGWGFRGLGQVDEAITQFELSLAEAGLWGERISLASSYENLGDQEYRAGRFEAAHEHLATALKLYRESASEQAGVLAQQILCQIWIAQGELDRARGQILQVLAMESGGNETYEAQALAILGQIQTLAGELEQARESFARSRETSNRVEDVPTAIEAEIGIGFVEQRLARWDDAATHFQSAVKLAASMDPSPWKVMAQRHLGQLQAVRGDLSTADAELTECLTLAQTMRGTLEYAPAVLAVADLRLRQGALEDALDLGRNALAHSQPVEQTIWSALHLARVQALRGDAREAQVHANQALTLAEVLRCPWLVTLARSTVDAAWEPRQPLSLTPPP